ncbi:MAG: Sua5/YciO/YrdC/YwlC family protein [Bacteroidetes bacterium]|nr:Sua5/YciO/YrdC/YwlC family protein [Bacteroidota bacterium]
MGGRSKRSEPWHDDARQAVRVLREGGILLHATDTVWGLACDATNDEAVKRLNALKARHPEHPVLVLVADEGHVEQLVDEVPEAAWDLMEHSDRPTTVVYPSGKGVSDLLKGANGSLAIRCIREDYTTYIIRGLGKPIASTSANLTGGPTPRSFRDVPAELKTGVNHVSAHRRDEPPGSGVPSMMVAFDEHGRFQFLRK